LIVELFDCFVAFLLRKNLWGYYNLIIKQFNKQWQSHTYSWKSLQR